MMPSYPTTAPAGGEPRPWSFPSMVQTVTESGLLVAAIRMPALPIVQVRWSFRGGKRHEPVSAIGTSQLLQASMRHGTESYDSAQLAEVLDEVGARMSVSISADGAVMSVSSLTQHLDRAIALCHEVVFTPTLPEAVLERERAKAVEMHRHDRSQADTLAGLWLARALYGDHPYGRPSTTEAGLQAATPSGLRAMHQQLTHPGHGLLLVVGDVDPEAIVAKLVDRYGRFREGESAPALSGVPVARRAKPRAILVERTGAQQASIVLGSLSLNRGDPDYRALRLANQVFGGGASSRLFMELRERQSLTYGAYSSLDCGLLGGDLTAGLSTANDKADAAVKALYVELDRMATGEVSEDELAHAKRYLIGAFPQRASGIAGVAALANAGWLHSLPIETWSHYQANVAAVAHAEVNKAAKRWFQPADCTLVVAGEGAMLDTLCPAIEARGLPIQRTTMADLSFEAPAV
jgi:zinc protease